MKQWVQRVWLAVCLLLPGFATADNLHICQADSGRYGYRIALAQLILDRTRAPGTRADRLIPFAAGSDPSQDRCLALLRQGQVRLLYLPPSEERLAEFDAIKIDLHQGILGYRLLLIHKKDQELFAQVQGLDQLRNLVGGFGAQWTDFKLFERNGLPVVGVGKTDSLLAMLEAGRFQYFHRGLHEAWAELEQHPELGQLMVEPRLALAYPLPVYFLFNKKDVALRQRFERGFQIIRNDGSFKALFLREFGPTLARAQLKRRLIIRVDYPPPAGVPPAEPPFWLN
nr:hypothetical protein [uncultured Roseateles sp.]